MSSENELQLPAPPSDGVTAVRFSSDDGGAHLLASSWDATVRLYDGQTGAATASASLPSPVLDADFVAGGVASAGLDGAVRLHADRNHLASTKPTVLGTHNGGVRCLRACAAAGPACLVSGSWDRSLKLWDVRASSPCVGTYEYPGKVLSLCAGAAASTGSTAAPMPLLVVAFTNRQVALLDLRQPTEPMQTRESPLKDQTRCVAQMPSGDGYTLGSVEGRVAVEYVDPSPEAQARKYAFKCHRTLVGGVDTLFPVNAIAFHPTYGSFATGGCDGHVYVWDGARKKRISSLPTYPTSIASLAFSPSGDRLAVAASYTYEHGEQEHPPNAIFLRKVIDAEVKPGVKQSKAKA
jgi:cell cycle arrest protein BUB3